jgi:ABC-type glutathione transport system ATPase component
LGVRVSPGAPLFSVFQKKSFAERPHLLTSVSTPLIQLTDVDKHFGANHALKSVSLDIIKSESLALIGPSASGKTLLLKTIMGLIRAALRSMASRQ